MSAEPGRPKQIRADGAGDGAPVSAQRHDDEDLHGLFAAFGGDVGQYQEFGHATASADPSPNWTLLNSLGADPRQTAAAAQPPVAVTPAALPAAAPTLAPTAVTPPTAMPDMAQVFGADPAFRSAPVFPPAPVRSAATVPLDVTPAAAPLVFDAATPTPLAAQPAAVPPAVAPRAPSATGQASATALATLFERLAQAPAAEASGSRTLMAHWRRPS